MGILSGGPWGILRGKTGNNIGRYVNRKNLFSMKPQPSSKAATAEQNVHRLKFSMVMGMTKEFLAFVNIGFKGASSKMSPLNSAVKYNLKHAVTGIAPECSIDYPEFSYSRGNLAGVTDLKIINRAEKEMMECSWLPNSGGYEARDSDLLTLIVYSPFANGIIAYPNVAKRSALKLEIQRPWSEPGEKLHGYLNMISADGKMVSDSQYLNLSV